MLFLELSELDIERAKKLKALRKYLGITQELMASYLDIPQSLYSMYENCRISIPNSLIDKVYDSYNVDIG